MISASDMCWHDGLPTWIPVSEIITDEHIMASPQPPARPSNPYWWAKTTLKLTAGCLATLIGALMSAVLLNCGLGDLIFILVIEGISACAAWSILHWVFRLKARWPSIFISTFFGLANGWYCSFRIYTAAMLQAVWMGAERSLGHKLSAEQSTELYNKTAASQEFWNSVHQRAPVPAFIAFLFVLLALVVISAPSRGAPNLKKS